MILFAVIIGVACISAIVIGSLFYLFTKESDPTFAKPLSPEEIKKMQPASALTKSEDQSLPAEFTRTDPRVEELQGELKELSDRALGQAREAKSMLDTLSGENQQLKEELERLKTVQQQPVEDGHVKEIELKAGQLQQDNLVLRSQLDSSHVKLQELQQEMDSVKQSMTIEIKAITQDKERLAQEVETLKQSFVQDNDASAAAMRAFDSERQVLVAANSDLQMTVNKLQDLNNSLTFKVEMLQTELIKLRAQASGLERVCGNYASQIEDISLKLDRYETNERQWQKVHNRLQEVVEQTKLENDQLSQREKLAQFELQKSRDHIVGLERSFQEYKGKTSSDGLTGEV